MKTKKLLCLLLLLIMLLFVGCEVETQTLKSVSYELDKSELTDEIEISKFDLSDLKIIIKYSTGTEAAIDVTEDMLSEEDLNKLNTVGTHIINIKYKDLDQTVTINLIADSTTPKTTYVLDTSKLSDETKVSDFKLSNISIIATHENGDKETITVTSKMLSEEDNKKLESEGTKTITISYEDFTQSIEIKLIKNDLPDIPSDIENISVVLGLTIEQQKTTTEKHKICGKIEIIDNTTYGNMYIADDSGRIKIYGLYDEANNRYDSLTNKPEEGDTITVEGCVQNWYGEYELINAILLSLTKAEKDDEDDPEKQGDQQYEDASGYYADAKGLEGTELKLALRTITSKNFKSVNYSSLNTYLQKTDASLNDSNKILLFYTRKEVNKTWDGGSTWNKEHVWPQSKGWFTTSGAGSDAHHIRPVDSSENSRRGNSSYGVGSGYYTPSDNVKGDVARILFYLLVRYSEADNYKITSVAKSMDMLLEWNQLDPVDDIERQRNEEVYKIQNNRNPFIDNSDYAYYIWDTSYLTKTSTNNDEEIETYVLTQVYCIIENKKGRKGLFLFL